LIGAGRRRLLWCSAVNPRSESRIRRRRLEGDGAAQEREKRGFGCGGERRLLRGVYVRRRGALRLDATR
jgi:hypothetical protein